MTRFVDYFVIVGYDFDKQRGSASSGKVLQRFPETDWSDCPYIEGVELFCQPQGWRLTTQQQSPTFFTAVLTDINAQRHYCSCLSFFEEASLHPNIRQNEEEVDMDAADEADLPYLDFSSNGSQCTMFVPKCLALVSRNFYLQTFRECLSLIFSIVVDNEVGSSSSSSLVKSSLPRLETVIGTLLASITIPKHVSGNVVSFSLGADDVHYVKAFESPSLPVTGICVHRLVQELGIHAVLTLFSAVMTEHKILFHSKSYTRLHDACHALTSLMYPFKYSHVYIPILPASLFEVLSTPTPFVIGVHSSRKKEVADILDVIIVDLDGGCVAVPDCVHIPSLDEASVSELTHLLCAVTRPDLFHADDAFQSNESVQPSQPDLLDKEIRAIFIRFFAILLCGYRTCLQSVRIHPHPFISFHKALFLGQRNLVDNEFAVRVLDSMFFNSFVQERGLPFRPIDLFDDFYSNLHEKLQSELRNPAAVLENIRNIAQCLWNNEAMILDDSTSDAQKIISNKDWHPKSSLGSKVFPLLDSSLVTVVLESERIQHEMNVRIQSPSPPRSNSVCKGQEDVPQFVAVGPSPSLILNANAFNPITNSARRLEVMKNCIKCIFENKITDAKKTFPAVLRALKNNSARLALAHELSYHVAGGSRAQLGHEQFELVVKLMNCALQQESDALGGTASGLSGYEDVNGVASAIIPLAMAFCRKLATHVIQFAYTCLQDHTIWDNISFWEASFYHDVCRDVSALYSITSKSDEDVRDHLEVVAHQLQLIHEGKLTPEQIEERGQNEEKTLFSQAVHYANRIVWLKIPLDVGCSERAARNAAMIGGEGHNDSPGNSTAWGKESFRGDDRDGHHNNEMFGREGAGPPDDESGFEEDRSGSNGKGGRGVASEVASNAIKFTTRFVDKVCSEGELPETEVKALHQMVPVVVAMQIETLDGVYKESKKLPPVSKPKIMMPHLLPGEELALEGLRVFLIPDGRDEIFTPNTRNTANVGLGVGPVLLPAEGAIFLTNYRVIFRGRPVDPFYAECPVVRSFPIVTLTKEKRINLPSSFLISTLDHFLHEGLQLRSNAFQLIKIAFDEEVSSDSIESFKKMVNKARSPSEIFTLFAFTSQVTTATQNRYLNQQKAKEKGSTFKNVGKKTLRRAAALTGIQVKSKKNRKYLVQHIQSSGPARRLSPSESIDEKSLDNVSFSSELTQSTHSRTTLPVSQLSSPHHPLNGSLRERDSREIQRLTELLYFKDYVRLGLGSAKDVVQSSQSSGRSSSKAMLPPSHESFRISCVNNCYSAVSSYPCFLVVPRMISDECVSKLTRGYRQGRFPVITWMHPRRKGLLLRGSSFHGKGVIGILKGTSGSTSQSVSESSYAVEQEKYIRALITLTPSHFLRNRPPTNSISLTSFSSAEVKSIPESLSNTMIPSLSGTTLTAPICQPEVIDTSSSPQALPHKKTSFLQKSMNTLRTSGGKGTINSIGSSVGRQIQKLSHLNHDKTLRPGTDVSHLSKLHESSHASPSSSNNKTSLYIIGEKSLLKGVKSDQLPNCEFFPVELHDVKHVKQAFRKLLRACCPSSASTDPDMSFHKQIKGSEWYQQMQSVIQYSVNIVDLLDIHGASVMVCLEDGWDLVPQLVSLSQICLDPYYRTFHGFRTLIEKEWLAFGHRFTHRSNHVAATLTSGFAPVFLQFLDMVHQIMNQFPLSFEFNHHFLKFLAYHYVSCRFRTFLLDCEGERAELGWLQEDLKQSEDLLDEVDFEEDTMSSISGVNSNLPISDRFNYIGTSFWTYAETSWNKSSIFYNFLYEGASNQEEEIKVLRPHSDICILTIWEYYTEESLAHGFSFDPEIVKMEKQRKEEIEATEQKASDKKGKRKICNALYDCIPHEQPSSISILLDQVRKLEQLIGFNPNSSWVQTWNKIEIPLMSTTSLAKSARNASFESLARQGFLAGGSFSNLTQKRLVNIGNRLDSGSNQLMYSHRPHRFEKCAYSKPTSCDHCSSVIWGIPVKAGMKCSDCNYNCHEKCANLASKTCSGYKSVRRTSLSTPEGSRRVPPPIPPPPASSVAPMIASQATPVKVTNTMSTSDTYYDAFGQEASNGEHITYQGYLNKRGNLLKNWKQRWFVLDSIKHELRYYDPDDQQCKGHIDLADVTGITAFGGLSFEMTTRERKRGYHFSALDSKQAQEWVEKIQACLQ